MITSFAYSQSEGKYALNFADVFVIKVEFKKEVLKSKCPCLKGKKCFLDKIVVSRVLYCPPNNSFDSVGLRSVKYIAINSTDRDKLKKDSSFFITARPSGSKHYIVFTKILEIDSIQNYQFYHVHAYLSELNPCKQVDRFEKYILDN